MRWLAFLLAAPAAADPIFEPVDMPPHIYTGGWEHFVGGGLAVLDCDGDTLPELVAAGGESPMTLLRNRGGMRFEPGAFPEITGATGAYPIDLDADGALDLVVLRVGPNVTLRGDGACGFAPHDFGIPDGGDAWTTAFSATWEDDGRPTLAFGNYVDRADPDGPFGTCDTNLLLRPEGEDWSRTVLDPGFCALSALFSDEDRDGAPTLRLSNDRHYYVRGGAEQVWSLSESRFLGPEDGTYAPSIWGMGIASRDVTGDGRPDLALTSMGDQLLLLSDDGGHAPAPYEVGATATRPHTGGDGRPSTGWHAAWGDVDNDGDADLFYAKGNVDQMPGMAMEDPNNLLLNEGGRFREVGAAAGIASTHRGRGAALADLDGDGRLDLAVVNRRAPLEVWRNVSEAGNAVSVELHQPGGNARAVGAWVEVRTEARVQTQEVTIGGGHAGGTAVPLHFGLGDAERAELRVRWPGGDWSDWKAAAPGRVTLRR
ncbi:CRTAC1 family protein [Jannaschia aquimarina]|uniref:ASPIC and UnbV n=1 Tax=Jannaschia aquimarina TaxID=935700 RepID=A0A0D1CPQ8_9RHOB|nr:CRTAC1 family protein [Jannaschia aquimarina]KIT16742.1 ASPIC and UnbV [Jannaschia aquimarina]SNS53447.1 Repeat domain-containing protein [Jannaschia aquimarina]